MMKTIQPGELCSPHNEKRTAVYDITSVGRTCMTARREGYGQRPLQGDEVSFIQGEGVRRPTGLRIACDPFTLPEHVRTKINHYADAFLLLFVFLPKLIRKAMSTDTDTIIQLIGKNEQVKKVFWSVFIILAGFVLVQVVEPDVAREILVLLMEMG